MILRHYKGIKIFQHIFIDHLLPRGTRWGKCASIVCRSHWDIHESEFAYTMPIDAAHKQLVATRPCCHCI